MNSKKNVYNCIEKVNVYREGKWHDIPEGTKEKTFMIQLEYGLS